MDQLKTLSLGRRLILGCGIVLLLDMFLAWQKVAYGGDTYFSQNAWHGPLGVLMGLMTLALVVWVIVRMFGVALPDGTPEAKIALGLGAGVVVFALLKLLTDDYDAAAAAYLGVLLSGGLAAGAWLNFQESGESLPGMPRPATAGAAAGAAPASGAAPAGGAPVDRNAPTVAMPIPVQPPAQSAQWPPPPGQPPPPPAAAPMYPPPPGTPHAAPPPPQPQQYAAPPPPQAQAPYYPPPPGGAAGYPPPGYAPVANQGTNGMAIASLVLGILWIYWLGSILALIFGYIGKNQIDRGGGVQGGRGLAIAGIVLGWIGVAILVLLVVVGFSLM